MENNGFRQLGSVQSLLFAAGGMLMAAGVGCFVFMFHQLAAALVFTIGALLFAIMQCSQMYLGHNITLRRLKSIMNLADLLFVLAGVLMVDTAMTNAAVSDPYNAQRFLSNMFTNWQTYIECVYNKWIILLAIAVMLELYTTHRISSEIARQEKKGDEEN